MGVAEVDVEQIEENRTEEKEKDQEGDITYLFASTHHQSRQCPIQVAGSERCRMYWRAMDRPSSLCEAPQMYTIVCQQVDRMVAEQLPTVWSAFRQSGQVL